MTTFDITHFNSGTQKEPDFLASFIARKDVLQFFLTQLRNTQDHQPAKHHLIVAPRGYGKTSLLRRIKIALRDDVNFKDRYIPLTFREEQHNVISLDVFWRNCLQSLLEAREDEDASEMELKTLDQLWHEHMPRSSLLREKQDGAPAWMAFANHCHSLNRRPVLLIDNLDTLLAGLISEHQWALRTILQNQEGPVLIAAASRYPESLVDNNSAFYDFFRIFTLKPLSDLEVMSCLRELASMRGIKGEHVRRLLETDPGRISALNTMAGGNPRTLSVLYTVLEANMSDDILTQLSSMLDTFTGWYQARTEELPLQSRAVFDALALNWNPMTAANVSKVTGLDTPTVSSHLNRLEKSGYVETVSLSKTKKSRNGYQVSERFFNIWYLMRNGPRRTRQAIKFLTIFLRSCFSRRELHLMAKEKLQNGIGRVESTLALAACIADSRLRSRLLETAELSLNQFERANDAYTLLNEMRKEVKVSEKRQFAKGALKQREELFRLALQNIENQNFELAEAAYRKVIALDEKDARPWGILGGLLEELNRYEEAEAAYRKAIALDEKWNSPLLALGVLLQRHLNRYEEAEAAYRKAIALNEKDARPWRALGNLLQGPFNRYEEAEAAYRKAIALDEKDPRPWGTLGNLLQKRLNRYEEAEAAYRKAIALDEKDARPWGALGNLLQKRLNRYEEAEAAYRKAIALDEKDARLWGALGNLLQKRLNRYEEAEAAYRKAIALDEKDARLWGALGNLLQKRLNRYEEAEAAYRKAIALDEKWNSPWMTLGNLLQGPLNRYEEAEVAYRNAIALDEKDARPWGSLGSLLQYHLNRYEEAEAAYRNAIALDEKDARPWGLLGSLLQYHLNRYEEAEAACRKAIALDENNAHSWGILGDLLQGDPSRYEEAEAAYRKAIALDEKWNSPWLGLGILLQRHLNRYEQAEAAYRKAIALDEKDARPWVSLGNLLHLHLNRYEEAEAAYRNAIALNEKDALPWGALGSLFQYHLNRYDEAETAYRNAIALDEKWNSPWLGLGKILQNKPKRYDEAEAAYRNAIALNEKDAWSWMILGNFLQDYLGRFEDSLDAYKQGLKIDPNNTYLLANASYLCALHLGNIDQAKIYAKSAKSGLSKSGKHLIMSMLAWSSNLDEGKSGWGELHLAITSNDETLWSNYIDDLQRLLAYVVVFRNGEKLKYLMIDAGYPTHYPSLYHAYCATLDGEDHLLNINPEVRGMSEIIYRGLERLIAIFRRKHSPNISAKNHTR